MFNLLQPMLADDISVKNEFKKLGLSLRSEDLVLLNQRLKETGFDSLGDLVRCFLKGGLTNADLVRPLAMEIASQIALTTQSSLEPVTSVRI